MPNKYEREIEEILRNLEHSEPRVGFGQRVGGRMRRKANARRSMPVVRLNFSEWCLAIAVVAALFAGGWEYAHGGGDLITGIIALVGAVCIALVALSSFLAKPRSRSTASLYNNVTPMRRNPLSRLGASWHLLMLKMRYRNRDGER
jgi:uncharacterized membrane protein